MSKSADDATQSMIANLAEKTGKPLEQWLKIARKSGAAKHGEIVSFLKSEHGLGHGYANLVAHKTLESDAGSIAAGGTDLVAAQYSGAKAGLRQIYDRIIEIVSKFGNDIEISPKKGYVSLRRSKQFAIVQPSTATRVDVGINLKDKPPTERLEASGSFNAMVTHRVRIEKPSDVDSELKGWLKDAYERA
jgi:hypothetical protein